MRQAKKQLSRLFLTFTLLCACVLLGSCTDSDDVGNSYRTFEGTTIKDYLDQNPQYSLFQKALECTGSLSLMSSYGKYTCFLPDNDAFEAYLKANGYQSLEELIDTMPALRQMVYYHIIDGEANGVGNYQTTSFTIGNIVTKNMASRFLYTTPSADGTTWMINNNARIIEANIPMTNGVIHKVDHVIEGSNDLLSDFINVTGKFGFYEEMLKLTGLRDKLVKTEDEDYVAPGLRDDTEESSPAYPQRRVYGFTALLEPDSLFKAKGLTSVDDIRTFAEKKYPAGAGKADNDSLSSLYQFVAYHLLPYKLTSSQLAPTRDMTVTQTFEDPDWQRETFRDGRYTLDNFLFPLLENSLIYVQKFVWRDQEEQTPVFNDQRNPYDPQWTNMNSEAADVVTIDLDNSNLDCLNGEIHTLTGLLYYDENVYHRRLRMDFTNFFPEVWNNDITNQNHAIPRGYFKNIEYDDKEGVKMTYWIRYGTHSYFFGDMFMMKGRCNVEVKIGPIPSGSYEVRIGFRPRTGSVNTYGVVQYYLDGEPCGIPLDQSKTATTPEVGFTQSYFYLYGGVEKTPITSWTSGRETADDYYGFDNDKAMHNLGYMKAPDSYCSNELANKDYSPTHAGTARNDVYNMRRVLKLVSWPTTTTHTLRISNLMDKPFDMDYIEFMPTDLIEDEDTH